MKLGPSILTPTILSIDAGSEAARGLTALKLSCGRSALRVFRRGDRAIMSVFRAVLQ